MAKDRVTEDDVKWLLDNAEVQEAIFFDRTLVVAYQFPQLGGWTIRGERSVVDPENFDLEIGRKYAREEVEQKLWKHLGVLKQLELSNQISWVKHWSDS